MTAHHTPALQKITQRVRSQRHQRDRKGDNSFGIPNPFRQSTGTRHKPRTLTRTKLRWAGVIRPWSGGCWADAPAVSSPYVLLGIGWTGKEVRTSKLNSDVVMTYGTRGRGWSGERGRKCLRTPFLPLSPVTPPSADIRIHVTYTEQ